MKEALNSEIPNIEDRQMRWPVRDEQLAASSKSGDLRRASRVYQLQIAEAAKVKAVAELRVAQIAVVETMVNCFDAKGGRYAQFANVAAQDHADAAERRLVQEACDEIVALEETAPETAIDDILAQVSQTLGIALPTDTDRTDISQRSHKSMADLKAELGPSMLNEHMVAQEKDRFQERVKTDRFAKLIADYSTSLLNYHRIGYRPNDETARVSAFDDMISKRDRLYEAVVTLRDYASNLSLEQTPRAKGDPAAVAKLMAKYKEARRTAAVDKSPRPAQSAEWQLLHDKLLDHETRLMRCGETGALAPLQHATTVAKTSRIESAPTCVEEPLRPNIDRLASRTQNRIVHWALNNLHILDDSVLHWIERSRDNEEWADERPAALQRGSSNPEIIRGAAL
ncbi:hypothetical protein GOC80_13285 [Sinorhizobium medicae]|nr:hypothetical protein [Sinorhizobium medicae]